jgi:hypothetical protein
MTFAVMRKMKAGKIPFLTQTDASNQPNYFILPYPNGTLVVTGFMTISTDNNSQADNSQFQLAVPFSFATNNTNQILNFGNSARYNFAGKIGFFQQGAGAGYPVWNSSAQQTNTAYSSDPFAAVFPYTNYSQKTGSSNASWVSCQYMCMG